MKQLQRITCILTSPHEAYVQGFFDMTENSEEVAYPMQQNFQISSICNRLILLGRVANLVELPFQVATPGPPWHLPCHQQL